MSDEATVTLTLHAIRDAFLYMLVPQVAVALLVTLIAEGLALAMYRESLKGRFLLCFVFAQTGVFVGFFSANARVSAAATAISTVASLITLALGWIFGKERIPAAWQRAMPFAAISLLLATTWATAWGAINGRAADLSEASAATSSPR